MIDCPQIVSLKPGEKLPINNSSMPIKEIIVDADSNNTINFRVLACDDENPRCGKDLIHKNLNATNKLCVNKPTPVYRVGQYPDPYEGKCAHIYYREQLLNLNVIHYLVAFINIEPSTTPVITYFENSIKALNINIGFEKIFFNIVFKGILIDGDVNLQKKYEKSLKEHFADAKDLNCRFHRFVKEVECRLKTNKLGMLSFELKQPPAPIIEVGNL
jgi:hypothetical protein